MFYNIYHLSCLETVETVKNLSDILDPQLKLWAKLKNFILYNPIDKNI